LEVINMSSLSIGSKDVITPLLYMILVLDGLYITQIISSIN